MALPAWGGAVGNALMDAAIGYTNALLDMPDEEEARLKRKRERERLESQIEVDKAHAEYYRRPTTGRSRAPIIRQLPDGTYGLYDELIGDFVPIPGSQVRAPKPLTPLQQWDQDTMKQIEREVGHPPPYTWDELQQERVAPLVDMLKTPRIYGGPTGFTTAEDIRNARREGQPVRETPGLPTQQPSPPTGSQQKPAQPPPPPAPVPSQPPAPASPKSSGPGVTSTPPTAGRQKSGNPYTDYYRGLDRAAILADLREAFQRDPQMKSGETQRRLIAARKEVMGRGEPDIFPGDVFPDKGITTTPPSPPAEQAPASTPTVPPAAAASPGPRTAQAPPAGGTVPTYQTSGQAEQQTERQKEAARQEEELQLRREEAARQAERLQMDKLNAARLEREEQAKRLRELTGMVSKEQEMMTSILFSQKVVRKPYYAELEPGEKEVVNRRILEPRRRKEEIAALKLAQPFLDELDAIDATAYLTELIVPLLEKGNLGFFGRSKTWWEWFKSLPPWTKGQYYKEAEEELRAKGLTGALDDAMVKTRVAANIESNDDDVKKMMSPIAPQAALETYAAILAYVHAMTIKRTAGGTGRGIIKADMDAAHALFDPSLFFSSPDVMLTRLKSLQRYIQHPKPILEDRVRSYHIDPKNRTLLDFDIGTPASNVNPEPTPEEQKDLDTLKERARSRKGQ